MKDQDFRSSGSLDNIPSAVSACVAVELRQVTHAAHVALNQHPMLSGLTRPNYPLGRYIRLLTAYHHIYLVLEEGIGDFLASNRSPFDYAGRRKLPWLAADLRYFGIAPQCHGEGPLPPVRLAPPASCGALIGVLYAIEGATLGGQVISGHLRETLALTATTGGKFFGGYGDAVETQRRWQEFLLFAESIDDQPEQRRAAALAAQAVFALIEEQLNECYGQFQR